MEWNLKLKFILNCNIINKNISISAHILKIVLRFACSLPTSNSVSTSILRKCAINIGKILVQEETDFVLRALLITQAAFTIRHSLSLNDSKGILKKKKINFYVPSEYCQYSFF